jgi:hypothetical protein
VSFFLTRRCSCSTNTTSVKRQVMDPEAPSNQRFHRGKDPFAQTGCGISVDMRTPFGPIDCLSSRSHSPSRMPFFAPRSSSQFLTISPAKRPRWPATWDLRSGMSQILTRKVHLFRSRTSGIVSSRHLHQHQYGIQIRFDPSQISSSDMTSVDAW